MSDIHPEVSGIVVLASGAGSLCEALLRSPIGGQVHAVVTDVPNCGATLIAKQWNLPIHEVALADFSSRTDWEGKLLECVQRYQPKIVAAAGFMRILSPRFIDAFPGRIVNSHPALLPHFPGAHAVRDALAAGATTTGTTVHLIDYGVDTGPILAQGAIEIRPGESESELHERIKKIERVLFPETIAALLTR